MGHQRTCGEHGFTLVELLVAISLLAVLSGLFVNTVVLSKRMGSVSDRLLSARELDLLQSYLRWDLKNAFRLFRSDLQANRQQLVFRGKFNRLDLVLPANVDVEYGGLRRVTFLTETGTNAALRFVTLRRPDLRSLHTSRSVRPSKVILLEPVEAVSFRYFGTRRKDGKLVSVWSDGWERMDHLPRLVELNIVRGNDGHRTSRKIMVDLPVAR